MSKKTANLIQNKYKSYDINISKKGVEYLGKKYKQKEWFAELTNFRKFNQEQILLKNNEIKELPSTIFEFYKENVKKYTFLGLILPLFVFLLISLISFNLGFIFQNNAIFGFDGDFSNQSLCLYLIGCLFFVFLLILFVKFVILKERVYFTKIGGQYRYKHIKYNEFLKMCDIFNVNISKECYIFNEIELENIILREFKYDDLDPLYEIFKDPEVFKYLMGYEFHTISEANSYLRSIITNYKNNKLMKIAVVNKCSGELMGYVGLSLYDLTIDTCQIIYSLGQKYWGRGYVKEALDYYIPYLKEKGKQLIIVGHVKENERSKKVILKSGFSRCEEKDYQIIIKDQVRDICSYIIDFRKNLENNEEI